MEKHMAMLVKEFILEESSTSSEESSSDEEMVGSRRKLSERIELRIIYASVMAGEVREDSVPLPRIRNYLEDVVANYSDETFKSHFRMMPSTFNSVLHLIGHALSTTAAVTGCGRKPIPAEKQLLLALWYMGTPDSYRSVCEKFNVGRATALRALRRVTYALHCASPQLIQWPTGPEALRVKESFLQKSQFPNVIGAVDGTHIKIDAPRIDAQSYVTRKDIHAVHLQAVCDDRALFTHCLAGNAASVHDARVLKNSAISRYMEAGEAFFPGDSHLVGDGAYAVHPKMMVPFRDNGNLTAAQKNFNCKLSSARQVIERAFGLLKGRFRSLRDNLPLVNMEKVPEFIIACCVLHNICSREGDEILEVTPQGNCGNPIPIDIGNADIRNLGKIKRNRIMQEIN